MPEGLQEPKAISNGRSRDNPLYASRIMKQVAEKRQTASQAENDANLAKQSDMSKNTQHKREVVAVQNTRNL